MRNTRKPSCLLAKRAERRRRARWRRLRIERNMMGNLTQESDAVATEDGQCLMRKRRTSLKEIPSCESQNVTRKDVDIGGDLTSVNIPSDSGSGTPVCQLTGSGDGAEWTLVEESIVCREKESENLDYLSHGLVSVIGRRRVMEDAVAVEMGIAGGKFAYFAVYDGHGGSAVAKACSVGLHNLLANEIEGSCGGFDWAKMMSECFKKMDEEVNECLCGGSSGGSGPARMVGSTAVVVVVGKVEVVVANCGDSRAIMCRDGIAVALSHDHKPDRPDERERVEAAGGMIINWNGSRVLGVLATSRSIGDQYLKPYVISEPEVTVSKRTVADDFIIIASDGLWDVVSNELACEVVKLSLIGQIKKKLKQGTTAADAAAILAELAIAKGSKDNISVIVVELKKNPALTPLDLPDRPHSDL